MQKIISKELLLIGLLTINIMAIGDLPSEPINLGIYNITDTSVRLSFKDMANNEVGFIVQDVKKEKKTLVNIPSSDLYGVGKYNYVNIRKLKPFTSYTINVVAYNSNGLSSPLQKSFMTLPSGIISSKPINKVPVANAGIDKNISFGKSIEIIGSAIDSDGLISSYLWTENGQVLANTAVFNYTPSSKGFKKLTLTVVDDDGAKDVDSMSLMVIDKDMVSINDFGAIPNDNKDDTEAIKKALQVNGHILMEKGIYNVQGITRLNKKTIIDGNGSTFISELDTSNGGRTSKNILRLKGDEIIIKNLTLDGAYTSGNAKELPNVSSLLHIYDSKNILLEGVDTINHASNWWSTEGFNFSELKSNHAMDMYHVIYIGFSKKITIRNMEQKSNIKTEGLLIYESDNIDIDGFKSYNSPQIWTSLNIMASDDIKLNHIEVGDGSKNQGGSSINFIANHHFSIKNTKTSTKQGFDISNEILGTTVNDRIGRDTSYGIFEDCYFEGQRAFYGYPTINKSEDLTFKNTRFVPTKEGYATWSLRIQKAGNIKFENCIFGSEKFKTSGIIMGDSELITLRNSTFINPSVGLYIFGKTFGKLIVENNIFKGNNYSPINFYWSRSYGQGEGGIKEFHLFNNKIEGTILNNKIYNINGDFKIEKIKN